MDAANHIHKTYGEKNEKKVSTMLLTLVIVRTMCSLWQNSSP